MLTYKYRANKVINFEFKLDLDQFGMRFQSTNEKINLEFFANH